MIFRTGRAIARRLAWRGPPSATDRVAQLSYNLLRVTTTSPTGYSLPSEQTWSLSGGVISIGQRSFATKPASRPKAHTGRTTSKPRKKATTTTKAAASKTPSTEKAKSKAKPKAKSTVKPKAKPKAGTTAKAKPKTSAKSKAKPKVRAKKTLTAEQVAKATAKKDRARIVELKKKTLTVPKLLPANAYTVVLTELAKDAHSLRGKEASVKYKSLTPEELEHYNHLANTNAAANKAAYDKFILSHTPDEILTANHARRTLGRLLKKPGNYRPLHDERLVKSPLTSYVRFFKERVDSGDYKHMNVREMTGLIAKEWKELGASQKKKYQEDYVQDRARYEQEFKTVYGRDPGPRPRPRRAAAAATA